MSQLHLHAGPDDVAEFVLLPGDPNRASRIADAFLDDVVRYNDHRQLLGYSGTYRGLRVSVQATGMGCPSLAIVTEELIRLGATTLVRVGTAGIVSDRVRPGELIVATGSVANDGDALNALNAELLLELATAFDLIEGDADVRAAGDHGRGPCASSRAPTSRRSPTCATVSPAARRR
jgi:purine-nucleoside phosphorylase